MSGPTSTMRRPSSAKAPLLLGAVAALGALAGSAPGIAQSAGSAPAVAMCPAHLDTAQSAAAPQGWSVQRLATAKPLAEVAFFDGPLAGKVQLAPSSQAKRGGDTVSTWVFDSTQASRHLACLYRGTDVVLIRALPPAIRHCSVTLRGSSPATRLVALTCR